MSDRKVAVVTGASRGAGAGIARALGQRGFVVYVTGRTAAAGANPLPGTIGETAAAVSAAGGQGIGVKLDHAKDSETKALFERIADEQGRLDILVNNATALHDDLFNPAPFWEKSVALVDILDVGLRSHYVASYYAAPMLARQRRGLVAFTSSFGAGCYMYGPAYGAQKAGVDKFAADMAVDFREYSVAAISLWMGMVATERADAMRTTHPGKYDALLEHAETPEFSGHVIGALYEAPDLMALSGKTLIGAEIARTLGVTDVGGKNPPSHREILGAPREAHPAVVR